MSFPVVLKKFIFFNVTSEKLLSVANSKHDYSAGLNQFQTFGKFLIPILKRTLCYKLFQCRKLDFISRKAVTERFYRKIKTGIQELGEHFRSPACSEDREWKQARNIGSTSPCRFGDQDDPG
jgi:hypothetical protein